MHGDWPSEVSEWALLLRAVTSEKKPKAIWTPLQSRIHLSGFLSVESDLLLSLKNCILLLFNFNMWFRRLKQQKEASRIDFRRDLVMKQET